MATVYISRYALKTGKILMAELISSNSNGIALCRLSDGTIRHYDLAEWSRTLEEALQKAEVKRKKKIYSCNTLLKEFGDQYLENELIRLGNMKITDCDSEVPVPIGGYRNITEK